MTTVNHEENDRDKNDVFPPITIKTAISTHEKAGKVSEAEMKEKLLPFIGGSQPIGGIMQQSSGKIYSFAEALELRWLCSKIRKK